MANQEREQPRASGDRTPLEKMADLTRRIVHVPKEEVPKVEPKKRKTD